MYDKQEKDQGGEVKEDIEDIMRFLQINSV